MEKWGYEDVNGVIIGGYYIKGQLFYDNRPQGSSFTAETEETVKQVLLNRMKKLKEINWDCYQDGKSWEIRFYY